MPITLAVSSPKSGWPTTLTIKNSSTRPNSLMTKSTSTDPWMPALRAMSGYAGFGLYSGENSTLSRAPVDQILTGAPISPAPLVPDAPTGLAAAGG